MTPVQQILIESLAQLDALHEPLRDPMAPYWPAVWALRRAYPSNGLPYRGSGSKDRERDLNEAVAVGWIVRRRARQKTIACILTAAGMAEGWRLTGEHPWGHVVVALEILRLAPAGELVPEIWLNEGRGWGDGRQAELKVIERANRPALASGLVASNCSIRGNVAYHATGVPLPDVPPGGLDLPCPEPDPDAARLYHRAYRESIAWLNGQTAESVGDGRGVGEIPLVHCVLGKLPAVPDRGGPSR